MAASAAVSGGMSAADGGESMVGDSQWGDSQWGDGQWGDGGEAEESGSGASGAGKRRRTGNKLKSLGARKKARRQKAAAAEGSRGPR